MKWLSVSGAAFLVLQATMVVACRQTAPAHHAATAATIFLENNEILQVSHLTLQRRINPGSFPQTFENDDTIVFVRSQPGATPDMRIAFSELAQVDYYPSTSAPCVPLLTLTDGRRIVVGTLRHDLWPPDMPVGQISVPELEGYQVKEEYQMGGESADGLFRNSLLGCPREARGDEFLRVLRIAFTP